jgi:hypothetical protein
VEIHDSTFQSNTAYDVSSSKTLIVSRNFLNFLYIPAHHMEQFQMTTALSILLGSSLILAQRVRLRIGFHFHHFPAPS